MAYMHESVHVCHLMSRFLMTSPYSKGYPSIFISELTGIAPRYKKGLNFLQESGPKLKEMDKKVFSDKIFLMDKKVL